MANQTEKIRRKFLKRHYRLRPRKKTPRQVIAWTFTLLYARRMETKKNGIRMGYVWYLNQLKTIRILAKPSA